MSRSRTTLAITALTVLTITFPAPAGYRDYSKAISISGGEDHTLVATANNRSWACGPNGHRVGEVTYYYGVLGTASNDPDLEQKVLVRIHGAGNVGYLEGVWAIGAGWQHSLALDVNDSVWSWGWNSKGQLGVGDDQHRTTPVQVFRGDQAQDPCQPSAYLKHIIAISAGRSGEHSLAVDADGYPYGWGYNKYGQCGNGLSGPGERELTPDHVRQGVQADDPDDANDYLKHIIAVSGAQTHSIALEEIDPTDANYDGKVYTFGSDSWPTDYGNYAGGSGKLGVGNNAGDSNTPVCVHRGEQDYNDPNQIYLKHIVAVSAGWDHSMAVEQYEVYDPFLPNFDPNHKGRVYTWGNNGAGWDSGGGRLGDGSTTSSSTPVVVLRGEQQAEDPCNPDPNLTRIVAVSAGEGHSMALDANGCVYCWGHNKYGQLGNGCDDPCTTPVRVVGEDGEGYLENIVAISAGYWHSLAIDGDGVVWVWGKTKDGRLGLADMAYADPCVCAVPHRIPVVYDYNDGGVGKDFAFSIQDAINDANEGDVLEASWGIYYENVTFGDESITLKSENPEDPEVVADTTVDARYNAGGGVNDYYPAVDFNNGSGSTLAGLTLRNATGGGVLCENVDSVTIMNCLIQNNEWHGIWLNASSAGIQNCDIRANTSDETYDSHGVYCISGSDVNIVNCIIADNDGNGISCKDSSLRLTNCIIQDNADYGIYEHNSTVASVIANNIIRGNTDNGIFSGPFSSGPEIKNNWIYSNGGSGIETYNPSAAPDTNAVIVNNTIVNNDANGVKSDYAADVNITNCIIWDSGTNELYAGDSGTFDVTYSCIEGGYTGMGNINSDPYFVDAGANDFHLAANSPCIDKGDPAFEPEPNETDIDGGPRVINERVDMGADEFWATDFNRDGLVNFIDYALLTSYWQDAGVDYNDVFLYGDSNSVGLKQFCDDWLRGGGSPPGPLPLMAGRGGAGMVEGLGLDAGLSAVATAERGPAVAEPVDIEAIMKWLAEIWLDPDVRKSIDEENFLKFYESLKELD